MQLPPHINTDPNRERKKPSLLMRWWRKIVALHGSPREIALGVGIGMFIALSPTVGLQMILGAIIATILGASRPAAIITCWITNAFTIPPIYAATYFLGALVWPGASASFSDAWNDLVLLTAALGDIRPWDMVSPMREALTITGHMFMPMVIGGIIAGAVLAPISYILTLRAVRRYRRMRGKLRHRVRLARKAAKDAAAQKQVELNKDQAEPNQPTPSSHNQDQSDTDPSDPSRQSEARQSEPDPPSSLTKAG